MTCAPDYTVCTILCANCTAMLPFGGAGMLSILNNKLKTLLRVSLFRWLFALNVASTLFFVQQFNELF